MYHTLGQLILSGGLTYFFCRSTTCQRDGAASSYPEKRTNIWRQRDRFSAAFLPGMLAHAEEGHVVNTSSGNGGLILIPGTPIYSTSKSAVSAFTEVLHYQLLQQQSKLHVSVLYPGPHIVSSNIFSASRNRPEEFEREVPQVAPPMTLELLRNFARQAGAEMQTTSPDEVAEHFFDGIRRDAFYILPETEDGDARFKARVERVLHRRNPEPPI